MNKKLRVAMVQGIFPHYREAIFSKLDDSFDFKLFHSDIDNGIPQRELQFSNKVGTIRFKGLKYLKMTLSMVMFRPNIIIHEFSVSMVNLYLCYLYSKLTGCKFIIWGHGYDRKKGFFPKRNVADRVRSFFIKSSDAIILYSDDVQEHFQQLFNQNNFFVARNSIQAVDKEALYSSMLAKGRVQIKTELGFDSDVNIAFVARLSPIKKVRLLCELVGELELLGKTVTVHVVGDGEDYDSLVNAIRDKNQRANFVLYGALYDESKVSEIIFSSDFMVIPAWLGLTVNHSFCYSTPVATLINEKHPPEIEFAIDGCNSLLAESMINLGRRISDVMDDQVAFEKMREEARTYFVRKLGVENMYSGFSDAINKSICKGSSL